jgi:hypothetical protein
MHPDTLNDLIQITGVVGALLPFALALLAMIVVLGIRR